MVCSAVAIVVGASVDCIDAAVAGCAVVVGAVSD